MTDAEQLRRFDYQQEFVEASNCCGCGGGWRAASVQEKSGTSPRVCVCVCVCVCVFACVWSCVCLCVCDETDQEFGHTGSTFIH